MKRMKIIYAQICLFVFLVYSTSTECIAQSVETGFIKEYNGQKAKTPLAGVELSVNGAPSTISDSQGRYELRFAILKPGEAIKCNEIYKDGYVIFNKDALDYWRISNNKKPFVIVMCKESAFRELKKKFYGIIEKSYRDEYEKQVTIAQQTAANAANLETKIKLLKKEYEDKLSNINTYVELFARIDRSEIDSIVGRALVLIEEGRIDEGIKVYEELRLLQQVDNQLGKWQSGENMLLAANEMIHESQRDLVLLTEKLQQQIGLYEMGGADYKEKRIEMTERLVSVYRQLNRAFVGKYNEELGYWICTLTVQTKSWKDRTPYYREAAQLPSWHGAVSLGDLYEVAALSNNQLVDSVRFYYTQALKMNMPDSMKVNVQKRLLRVGDFCESADNGDTLYYKIVNESTVYVSSRTNMCSNKVSGNLTIPEYVEHNGRKYQVIGISARAFYKNRHVKNVILPNSINTIESSAFQHCDSLETIAIGNITGKGIEDDAIPLKTIIKLPQKIKYPYWIEKFVTNRIHRINNIRECYRTQYYKSALSLLTDLCHYKSIGKDLKALCYVYMGNINIQFGDTIKALENYLTASQTIAIGNLYVAGIYDIQGKYKLACQYYKKCIGAYNGLDLYDKGKYAELFLKAIQLVDKAIVFSSDNENDLDSKDEFYLMMGQREKALEYWNKVLEKNPKLFKQLFPQKGNDINKTDSIKNERLQDYVNLIQLVAEYEYSLLPDAFYGCDYEELVSIGILAVQVLIKNKTEEQLDRYNAAYLAVAIRWAIRNELRIRYDWYSISSSNNSGKIENSELDENNDENNSEYIQNAKLTISVYSTVMMIFKQLIKKVGINERERCALLTNYKSGNLTKSEIEIINIGEVVDECTQELPISLGQIIKMTIVDKKTLKDTAYEMDLSLDSLLTLTEQACDSINNRLNSRGLYGFTFHKDYDNRVKIADIPQKYESIVHAIALTEFFNGNNLNIKKEEMESIGSLAIQVLIKNKTEEQLAKCNNLYFACAIQWAIRNELRIRYKDYKEKKVILGKDSLLEDSVIQKIEVRVHVYKVVGDIYRFQNNLDTSSFKDEMLAYASIIKKCIDNSISEENRAIICDAIFSGKSIDDIAIENNLSLHEAIIKVNSSLNIIKEELNKNNKFGY